MLVNKDSRVTRIVPENARLIVAHVNHGIRPEDAERDEEFVRSLASSYGLEFTSTRLQLGPQASEESARSARYKFLESVMNQYQAQGIVLAHHRQDVLETAVINTIRGSGRRGITSLRSTANRLRPLLSLSKDDILSYAREKSLQWVEDSTNDDPKYLRNRIRLAMREQNPEALNLATTSLAEISRHNDLLDKEIATLLQYKLRQNAILSRSWFVKLPHVVACELVHALLIKIQVNNIDRELVERVVIACKVARPGSVIDIDKVIKALVTKRSVRIVDRATLKARRL
jgi:tRNA(Ile)-lysidine synthase